MRELREREPELGSGAPWTLPSCRQSSESRRPRGRAPARLAPDVRGCDMRSREVRDGVQRAGEGVGMPLIAGTVSQRG